MTKRNAVMVAALSLTLCGWAQQPLTMTVEELFERVEQHSKSLKVLRTNEAVAAEGVEEARNQRLPNINSSLSVSYIGNVLLTNREFGDVHGYSLPHFGNSFSVEAQQVVYAGGAVDAGIRIAHLRREQATLGVETMRQQLCFLALGQFLELFKLHNSIRVFDRNIQLTNQLLADIRERHQQGMALRNDITRYELQAENLKLGKRKLTDQCAIINHQLCNLLDLHDVDIVPNGQTAAIAIGKEGEQQWQTEALTASPMMQQSALDIRMAHQEVALAKSEMLPKAVVFAAESFNGPFTYDIPPIDKNVNVWYLGVGISYPIHSLFKGKTKVRQAKMRVGQREEERALQAENLNNEVQAAYTNYLESFVEQETRQKAVQLATQNYQVVNERYLNQLALITDMVDASNVKLNAELDEVNAGINIIFAYYKLKYIAGTL